MSRIARDATIAFIGCVLVFASCSLQESGQAGPDATDLDVADVFPQDSSDAIPDNVVDAPDVVTNLPFPTIAGLLAWYRSDLGVSPDAGTIAWADQSDAGDSNRNLVQLVAAKTPTFTQSDPTFNNYPSFTTTLGKATSLATGVWSVPLAQPFTVFAVARETSPNGAWLFDTGSGGEVGISTHGGPGNLHMFAGSYGADVSASSGKTYALIAIYDSAATNSRLYVSSGTPQAGASIGFNAPSPLIVGDALNDATGTSAGWAFAEFAFFQGALAGADVSALNAYAASRYGLTTTP